MGAELIKLYEENPQEDKIEHIARVLKNGGLVIYPTDTIYGLGCDIFNTKALDKVYSGESHQAESSAGEGKTDPPVCCRG